MITTYRFPLEVFYENDDLKRVTEMLNSFGVGGKVGLNGNIGNYDVEITNKKEVDLPDEALTGMQGILQGALNEIISDEKYKNMSITVKKGYRL